MSNKTNLFKLSKEDLYSLYITENKTILEIANEYHYSRSTVLKWLKIYEIKKDKSLENINRKKAFIDKYGTDNPMKVKSNIDKMKATNKARYGVEFPIQSSVIKKKIEQTCLLKYGSSSPLGNVNIHTNTIRSNKKKYDLQSIVDFKPDTSKYEDEICDFLKDELQIENIIRNSTNILNDKMEIDIYLPDYKVGIEFNGSYWHSEIKKDKYYHFNKSKLGVDAGVFIYHVFQYEWIKNKNAIKNQLKNLLHKNSNKIYAKHCKIKNVDTSESDIFLNDNHRQKADTSSIRLGLYYKEKLVSLMTFVKPRFSNKHKYELSRFCSLADYNVVGAASKLFQYFTIKYLDNNDSVISYSDIARTKGIIYEILGFKLDHISQPNYIWWKNDNDYKTRYQTKIENEIKTMTDLGYTRIFDCGNKVWIYRKEQL